MLGSSSPPHPWEVHNWKVGTLGGLISAGVVVVTTVINLSGYQQRFDGQEKKVAEHDERLKVIEAGIEEQRASLTRLEDSMAQNLMSQERLLGEFENLKRQNGRLEEENARLKAVGDGSSLRAGADEQANSPVEPGRAIGALIGEEDALAADSSETIFADDVEPYACTPLMTRAVGEVFPIHAGNVCVAPDLSYITVRFGFTYDGRRFMAAEAENGQEATCFVGDVCHYLTAEGRDFVLQSVTIGIGGVDNYGCFAVREQPSA